MGFCNAYKHLALFEVKMSFYSGRITWIIRSYRLPPGGTLSSASRVTVSQQAKFGTSAVNLILNDFVYKVYKKLFVH